MAGKFSEREEPVEYAYPPLLVNFEFDVGPDKVTISVPQVPPAIQVGIDDNWRSINSAIILLVDEAALFAGMSVVTSARLW